MAKSAFIFIWCIGMMANILGQVPKNKLYQKITQADSVVLISHLTTFMANVDSQTKEWREISLFVKNKLNDPIVMERYRLGAKETDSLARILITRNNDREIENIRCFMPHHGILIYKKGKCSFFDICFCKLP